MAIEQANLQSGARYTEFDPSGPARDLTSTYPGFDAAAGGPESPTLESQALLLPRYVMFSGGDLDITDEFGTEITLAEADYGGKPLPIAPAATRTSSTATSCLVIW